MKTNGFTTLAHTTPQLPWRTDVEKAGKKLRKNQLDAWNMTHNARWCSIIGPMGSGKTLTIQAKARTDVMDHDMKAIIITPQCFIATGFEGVTTILWKKGKKTLRKEVFKLPATLDETSVEDIVQFLTRGRINDPDQRILICTHGAFVAAVKKAWKLNRQCLADVSLFVDEGHHVSIADTEDSDLFEDEKTTNQLGQIVKHMYDQKEGRVTIVTATWARMEGSILTAQMKKDFVRHEYPIDEYLKEMRWLRHVDYKFVVGDDIEVVGTILEQERKRTLVLMGHHATAELKMKKLSKLKRRIAPLGLDVCDLVTNENLAADKAQMELRKNVNTEKEACEEIQKSTKTRAEIIRNVRRMPKHIPDVIVARNRFCEGADCPPLERVIMMAPRGSIPANLQILGRALRDWPGKEMAEIIVVLPSQHGKVAPEKVEDYLKVIFASMVVDWQFKMPRMQSRVAKRFAEDLKGAEATDMMASMTTKASKKVVHTEGKKGAAVDAAMEALIIEELSKRYPNEFAPALKKSAREIIVGFTRLLRDQRSRFIKKTCDDIPLGVELSEVLTGTVGFLLSRMGYKTFREYRQCLTAMGDRKVVLSPTKEEVVGWILRYVADNHGKWPTRQSGLILYDVEGRTWDQLGDVMVRVGLTSAP